MKIRNIFFVAILFLSTSVNIFAVDFDDLVKNYNPVLTEQQYVNAALTFCYELKENPDFRNKENFSLRTNLYDFCFKLVNEIEKILKNRDLKKAQLFYSVNLDSDINEFIIYNGSKKKQFSWYSFVKGTEITCSYKAPKEFFFAVEKNKMTELFFERIRGYIEIAVETVKPMKDSLDEFKVCSFLIESFNLANKILMILNTAD